MSIVTPADYNSIVVADLLQAEVIRKKIRKTVIKQVANLKYQGDLRNKGDTVLVETFPRIWGYSGGTPGSTITRKPFAVKEQSFPINQVMQNGTEVKDIEEIRSNLALQSHISSEFSDYSAQQEDQFVASMATQAYSANKLNDKNPLTLAAGNTYSAITGLSRVLGEANAFNTKALFIDNAIYERLKLEDVLDSTDLGLQMRLNGQITTIDGFKLLLTNNLPHVRVLTLDTNPANTETFLLTGKEQDVTTVEGYKDRVVTFTIVTNGTAANPGEISLGGSLAVTQAIIIDAINGTGTPGASTYIELALADRQALQNALIKVPNTAFDAAEKITIQSAGDLDPSETFGDVTNIFGADAVLMFATDMEAINFVAQMDQIKVTDQEGGFSTNILQEKVYDGIVLDENNKGLATREIAV